MWRACGRLERFTWVWYCVQYISLRCVFAGWNDTNSCYSVLYPLNYLLYSIMYLSMYHRSDGGVSPPLRSIL